MFTHSVALVHYLQLDHSQMGQVLLCILLVKDRHHFSQKSVLANFLNMGRHFKVLELPFVYNRFEVVSFTFVKILGVLGKGMVDSLNKVVAISNICV